MLAFTVGYVVPKTRKDIGVRSYCILSSVLVSLHTLYIVTCSQTEQIISMGGLYSQRSDVHTKLRIKS
jgi:hypothetical protein